MNFIGKALVIGTFTLSIVLLGVAGTVYFSQRVLTTEKTSPANLDAKKYADLSDRFKKADAALQKVRKNYEGKIVNLAQDEEAYYSHPKFYDDELKALQDADGTVHMVARQNGAVVLDDKIPGRVVMVPAKDGLGQDVKSNAFYQKEIDKEVAAIAALSMKLAGDPKSDDPKTKAGLFKWHDMLTLSIYEILPPKSDPPTQGLRVELATELHKQAQLEKELEYLDDTKSKFVVDNDSLKRRSDQLTARKAELEKKLRDRN